MGGAGSGWQKSRKTTVAECLNLSISALSNAHILLAEQRRVGIWAWQDSRYLVIYDAEVGDFEGVLSLSFGVGGEGCIQRVPLVTTRPHFGGIRWWFLCPVALKGGTRLPVAKLYRPLGGREFGSRQALGLTYGSCQDSGKWRSFYHQIATATGCDHASVRRGMQRWARVAGR